MPYELNIDWLGAQDQVEALDVQLLPVINQAPGKPIHLNLSGDKLNLPHLNPGNYLLSLRYSFEEQFFDSFYFDLDIPEITLIQIKLINEGSQIQEMGFINESGEFVDMLIYEDQKPFLTRAINKHVLWQTLAEFLAFRIHDLTPLQAKKQLSNVLGDLSHSLPELEYLWPYQLKKLLAPSMLAQTSAEWKACLLHLLQNNLILMDNEGLLNDLQDAISLAQQTQHVQKLLDDLEWNSDTLSWINYDILLNQLKGHYVLL